MTVRGERARTRVAGVIVLAASAIALGGAVAGCSSEQELTSDRAASLGQQHLADVKDAITDDETVTTAWHQNVTLSSVRCSEHEARWVALATVAIKSTNDPDGPPTEMTGALAMRGWDPGSGIGDLDDDPATALAAAPEGENPGGFFLNVTIEPAGDSWRYIVNLSSACAVQ